MPRLLRRRTLTATELRTRADKSAAVAKRDADAVKFAEESALAQRVVTRRADAIQSRIDDDAKWNAQRAEVSGRLGVAQRNAWDLTERIERARTAVDDGLKVGDVEAASQHGMAVGSMQLTLSRAQSLVAQLQSEYGSIPVADITDEERQQVPLLRAIALSPEKSHGYIVPTLKVDQAAELRALGRRVAQQQLEHPTFLNAPTPMRDMRSAV